ncbi:unnamed protein product [Rhizophagus irregularis]|nr:unnamed protein product [Rhizophagus irregularis]CAB5351554.1 unnamed protein product [Rhizophagus irregularis]
MIPAFWIGWYQRPLLWIDIGAFTLDWYRRLSLWIGIGCDLWKPVVSIGIGWNLLDRCQLGPLEIKPVVYGFLVFSELNFKGQQLFG